MASVAPKEFGISSCFIRAAHTRPENSLSTLPPTLVKTSITITQADVVSKELDETTTGWEVPGGAADEEAVLQL